MYTITFFDKSKLKITKEERDSIINAKTDLVALKRLDTILNVKNIAHIQNDDVVERTNPTVGILHDGKKVFNYFGRWVMDTGDTDPDCFIYPDPKYYPEVACDYVKSVDEYNAWDKLTSYLPAKYDYLARLQNPSGFTALKSLFNNYRPQLTETKRMYVEVIEEECPACGNTYPQGKQCTNCLQQDYY